MPRSTLDSQYPPQLRTRELDQIAGRREIAQVDPDKAIVGLALSGGGIRSATFCLGVLQALARSAGPIRLRDVDVLSTVSGGGYIGAFLGAMFSREAATPQSVEARLGASDSTEVHWLRENGRYLAPNGAGDRWLAAATVLRNWVALALVASVSVLTVLMLGQCLERAAEFAIARWHWPWLSAVLSFESSGISWSPFVAVAAAVLIVVATPPGWAYWLGQPGKRDYRVVWGGTVIVTLAAAFAPTLLRRWPSLDGASWPWHLLALLGLLTLLLAAIVAWMTRGPSTGSTASRRFRNVTSRALTVAVIAVAAILGLALIDTLGRTAYIHAWWLRDVTLPAWLVGAVGVLLGAVRNLIPFLARGDQKKHVTIPLGLVGAAAGIVAAVLIVGALSTVSYGVARGGDVPSPCASTVSADVPPATSCANADVRRTRTLAGTLALLLLTYLMGQSLPFVNLSSLTQFYSARLARTYVGASNANRQKDGKTVTEEVEGDDIELSAYGPQRHGGPLHLVNVTVNETVGGPSQTLDRDRKGLGMTIGPAGLSVGVTHHATWNDGRTAIVPISAVDDGDARYRIWPAGEKVEPKPLSLSQWIAISGAAVATGMGAQTSLGLSLLLGIANVRLGYWWDSKVDPRTQRGAKSIWLQRLYTRVLPVQSALTDEFLAQFHGPHRRHWYLTDGGHFENTAAYELLRRRVPLIIVCDDGADPEYAFEDLANLVRKARIDFDTQIDFVAPSTDPDIGAFADIGNTLPAAGSRRSLLAAIVTYPDGGQPGTPVLPPAGGRARSLLIVIKPSLVGDEPLDVLEYAGAHPSFPQETTADQFFDEAQWESYRMLGEHIGRTVARLDVKALTL